MTEIAALAGCATVTIRRLLQIDGVPQRPAYRRPPPESGITREWLHREYVVKLRSIDTLARERGVCAPYLKNLARNWGLPVRRHSDFTMRTGALGRLELITQIPGHELIREAHQILQAAREQTTAHPNPERGRKKAEVRLGHAENPSATGSTSAVI